MTRTLLCGVIALGMGACISPLELLDTPCPCGPALHCCETSQLCAPSPERCPTAPPPSSAVTCSRDQTCPVNERCHAWSSSPLLGPSSLLGLAQCRRRCDNSSGKCDAKEICTLSPHDGSPLASWTVAPLCVPRATVQGCEEWQCSECSGETAGTLFCDGNAIASCMISAHPICGMACRKATVGLCGGECVVGAQGPACSKPSPALLLPCLAHPCAGCPAVGEDGCDGNQAFSCLRVPDRDKECAELCSRIELFTCRHRCVVSPAGIAGCE